MKLSLDEILELDLDNLDQFSATEILEMISMLELEAESDNVEQMALKILINSLYGALANKFFIAANPDLAAGITSSGRFFIRLLQDNAERELQKLKSWDETYVVASDTDSFYYTVEPLVKEKFGDSATQTMEVVEWCDRFDQKFMQKVVDDTINEYAELLNIFDPSQIGVEREIISDCAFFVAKKRYAARVLDMEGVRFTEDDPYIKVMGLEIARSSTPEWVKQKLQESIPVILDNDQFGVRKWRDETKAQYTSQPIETISAVGSASSLDYNLTDKGVPQGAKAVIAHNNWVKSQGLEDEIELLQAGEKYKRCYLLTPNRFGAEIISYNDSKIAKIIEEDGIFDYSTNFQKQFEGPLERMVEGMKFDIRDVPTFGNLEDW